ncbi:MAG: hypothetical protein HC905_15670 [Bacteroidales bacterium]|nr:hypothetical protein [Bacteroidales bacterium]
MPLTSGFGTITENIGKVKNTGVEFSLTTYNLTGKLQWNTSVKFFIQQKRSCKVKRWCY